MELQEIREDAFKNLTVKYLYLGQGNRISVLKKGSFRGMPNLMELFLENNKVPLSAHLFAKLGHLEQLVLFNNKINSIPVNSFAGLSNLTRLDLSMNNITAIGADIFSSFNPELQHLWLNQDNISFSVT